MKKILSICIILTMVIGVVSCSNTGEQKGTSTPTPTTNSEQKGDETMNYPFEVLQTKDPIKATITMENGGVIKLELYPEFAPISVSNFKYLAEKGFYNGLIFHRVIEGFMIQGGDPQGTGMGGPEHSIKGEFSSNGVNNPLKHDRGVLSMARSASPDSAGSQFFIMHQNSPHLDGQYAAFGKVVEGLSVVDEIATTDTDSNDKPIKEMKIKTITID